jgi:uncharacterized protein
VDRQRRLARLSRFAMLFLLSPAKRLDYDTPVPELPHTRPQFVREAGQLIGELRKLTPAGVARLMDLSDALASLNVGRYQAWSSRFTVRNSRQAILAFNGDVYEGLAASTLAPADLGWAQEHIGILSGLHGLLRPLDWMQPYRLEMGTQLEVGAARNLYEFWGTRLAKELNRRLAAQTTPVLVNLASQEYARAMDRTRLKARVIDCVFEEWKGGRYKIISFTAKRARGLMARYAITHRVDTPRKLRGFDLEGYAFDAAASGADRLVFRRRIEQ